MKLLFCPLLLPILLLTTAASVVSGTSYDNENILLIENATGLLDFALSVNSNSSQYDKKTVYLTNDIDMAGVHLDPIGVFDSTSMFNGVFDGRGHVIRNLNMTSDERSVGLFGHSKQGVTIRNLVLDSSNSFTSNSTKGDWCYTSAFFGNCKANENPCIIENSVNMGTVSFTGKTNIQRIMGAFHGACDAEGNSCITRNVANYGEIVNQGAAEPYVRMGGISGLCHASGGSECRYTNCMNYGNLIHNSNVSTADVLIGGIIGLCWTSNTIENCFNAGNISYSDKGSNDIHAGGITGHLMDSKIAHCFWLNGTSNKGYGHKEGNSSIESSEQVSSLDSDLISKLNSYGGDATANSSMWLLNNNRRNVTFVVDGRTYMTFTSEIIVVPVIADANFSGWYLDEQMRDPLDSSFVIDRDVTFYSTLETHVSEESSSSSSSSSSFSSSSELRTEIVKIEISTKILDDSEIETIIKGMIDCDDCYERIEVYRTSEEVSVIIKFKDVSSASNFVETIKTTSNSNIQLEKFEYLDHIPLSFSVSTPLHSYIFLMLA